MKKYFMVFGAGLLEQFGYTLYLLAVGRYMMFFSSILMFLYFFIYLLIINYAVKDRDNTIGLLFTYAVAGGVGNYIAMALHLIK
jgi:hypothetical protein